MNKPVAWIKEDTLIYLDNYNYASITIQVQKSKSVGFDIPLYTHPVKEQSNLVNVFKDHIEDLVRCVKLFRSYEMDNTADEMEVAIKELEDAIKAHPVELTDEEIFEEMQIWGRKQFGDYYADPDMEDLKLTIGLHKAILRKGQEK